MRTRTWSTLERSIKILTFAALLFGCGAEPGSASNPSDVEAAPATTATNTSDPGTAGVVAPAPSAEGSTPPQTVAEPEPDPSIAPPPFSASQIHAATSLGRTYRFRTRAKGEPAHVVQIEFVEVSHEGATTEMAAFDESGEPIGPAKRKTSTWADLVGHAAYPKDDTIRTEVEMAVEAGTFDCYLYTVTRQAEGEKRITKAFFAKELPGAPILLIEQTDKGEVLTHMEMIEHVAGGG